MRNPNVINRRVRNVIELLLRRGVKLLQNATPRTHSTLPNLLTVRAAVFWLAGASAPTLCLGFLIIHRIAGPLSCPSSSRSIGLGLCTLSFVRVLVALRPSPSAPFQDVPDRQQTRAKVSTLARSRSQPWLPEFQPVSDTESHRLAV